MLGISPFVLVSVEFPCIVDHIAHHMSHGHVYDTRSVLATQLLISTVSCLTDAHQRGRPQDGFGKPVESQGTDDEE